MCINVKKKSLVTSNVLLFLTLYRLNNRNNCYCIIQRPMLTLIIQGLQLAHQVAGGFDHIMVAFPGAFGKGERPQH